MVKRETQTCTTLGNSFVEAVRLVPTVELATQWSLSTMSAPTSVGGPANWWVQSILIALELIPVGTDHRYQSTCWTVRPVSLDQFDVAGSTW